MFSSRGTVRYEERGQRYRDVEKVGKHWGRGTARNMKIFLTKKIGNLVRLLVLLKRHLLRCTVIWT